MTDSAIRALTLLGIAFVTTLGACGSSDKQGDCSEGETIYCYCSDGKSGSQTCQSNGTYTTCDCSGGGFGGSGASGGSGGSGGSSAYPDEGDPCFEQGGLRCGAPGTGATAVFYCDGFSYAQVFACGLGEKCTNYSSGTSVRCDSSLEQTAYAYANKPCSADQSAACNFARDTVLVCSLGTWQAYDYCSLGGCGHVAPGWSSGTKNCPSTSQAGCTVCEF